MLQNLKRPLFAMSVVPSVLVEGQLVIGQGNGRENLCSLQACKQLLHIRTSASPWHLAFPACPFSAKATVRTGDSPASWYLSSFPLKAASIHPSQEMVSSAFLTDPTEGDHWLISGLRGVSSDLLPMFLELSWCWQSLATSCMGASRASVRSILYPANDTSVALSASDSVLGVCVFQQVNELRILHSPGGSTSVAETHIV